MGELAHLAAELAGGQAMVEEKPSRNFDVSRFCGDYSRAKELLGWTPQTDIRTGVADLIGQYRRRIGHRAA